VSAPTKLIAFVAALAVLFGGGALAGATVGPAADEEPGGASTEGRGHDATSKEEPDVNATSEGDHQESGAATDPVRGLAVSNGGLRIVVENPELRLGRAERLAFRIVDEHGDTVRDFGVEHTKRMHVILARRDLTGFQHLHPEQADDGAWTTAVRLPRAGSYRLFADFSRNGEAHTPATDLRVDGPADLEPLPAPQPTAVSDGGYEVRLEARGARPGKEARLRFTITKDGAPVETEPYLGAGGHLVALRDGDLAYLHVHPTEAGDGERAVGFGATFPTQGRYRLFLQFQHEGRVHTVAFTQEVA
jgi:hypothetical protein